MALLDPVCHIHPNIPLAQRQKDRCLIESRGSALGVALFARPFKELLVEDRRAPARPRIHSRQRRRIDTDGVDPTRGCNCRQHTAISLHRALGQVRFPVRTHPPSGCQDWLPMELAAR